LTVSLFRIGSTYFSQSSLAAGRGLNPRLGRKNGLCGAVWLSADAVKGELEGAAPAVVSCRVVAYEVGIDRENAREVTGGEAGPERAAGLGVADELGAEGE
jgi:hypothetical protein